MGTSSDQPTSSTSVNLSITEQLQGLHPKSRDVSISRVPRNLRQVNEKAFTPQMVSIGPFHHGKAELKQWEETKLWYLKKFLKRTKKSLDDCIEFVKRLEGRARTCYGERIDMTGDAFVKMMLVDSCFIVEGILWLNRPRDYSEQILLVQRDMILLENQIPFFVLHDLFHFNNPGEDEDEFLDLLLTFFAPILPIITEPEDKWRVFANVKWHLRSGLEVKHFTDLLRICHLPQKLNKPSADINFVRIPNAARLHEAGMVRIPNAARLHEAGMKFQVGKGKCLLDMNYDNGLLEMPKFRVFDTSEYLLKNIIALETCHYTYDSYIIDYILFMDMLIDTAADVDFLVQEGIIMNSMSDTAAVASLFNNLGMETKLFSPSYFKSISDDMNAYYKVPWHKWKAIFKRDYCSTPWLIASTVAAILLLVLTLIQTICSIISLF